MRIISQDGMRNVYFDNVNLKIASPEEWLDDNIFNSKLFWGILTTTNISLGGYTSKEKALKVMEMIWQPRHWVSSNALIKDCDFVPGFERYVFYMPKDEDVK